MSEGDGRCRGRFRGNRRMPMLGDGGGVVILFSYCNYLV